MMIRFKLKIAMGHFFGPPCSEQRPALSDDWNPVLEINCGPPTTNFWSGWSPKKRVNRDKKSVFCVLDKTIILGGPKTEFEGTEQWIWQDQKSV